MPGWHPLRRARVGDWVEYRTITGRSLRYDTVQVKASAVVSRVTIRENGAMVGTPALREDPLDWDPLADQANRHKAARATRPEVITVAGQRWQTTLYEDRWTDEQIAYVRRTWVCNELPYTGVVRMQMWGDGQLEAELTLVGWGKAKERP